MNLLEKYIANDSSIELDKNEDILLFKDFKEYQYSLIKYFVELSIKYISKIGNNYLELVDTQITDEYKYLDIYGYEVLKIVSKITHDGEIKDCINIYIPELIDNNFFYLGGVTYAPCVYIMDKPITVKEKSIKLFGLFSPITIFFKDKRVIFIGKNIPLSYFLKWFLPDDEDLVEQFYNMHNIDNINVTDQEVNDYFFKFFNKNTVQEVDQMFDDIFLDEYTKELYSLCYGIDIEDINTRYIIRKAINNAVDKTTKKSFVDLSDKRLVFIELILNPLFRKCSELIPNLLKGYAIDKITLPADIIKKSFFKDLKGNFTYDLVNFYSGIITHKASMLAPGTDNPPTEVSSMHDTHFGRICPVTITPKDPGESVGIIPDLRIHKIGLFIDENGEILR